MGRTIKQAWEWFWSASNATKAWTMAGLAVVTAAASLAAASTLIESTRQSAAASTVQGAAPHSSTSMNGMSTGGAPGSGPSTPNAGSSVSSMPGMTGPSGSAPVTVSDICPNVVGATVMSDGMEMAPVPSGPPTAAQQAAADQLIAATTADIQKYSSLSAAEAAGYKPVTTSKGSMTHYANWSLVRPNNVLNPETPASLMYANTVDGPVLVGAMYFGPGPCQPGPDIGGSLTDWHAHSNLCVNTAHQVVGRTNADGSCTVGMHNPQTLFMLHVWTAPQLAVQYQFQADLPPGALRQIVETGQP